MKGFGKSHMIRGKRYLFIREKIEGADGLCDPPTLKGKAIRIDQELEGIRLLEILIHEITHAANWDWDEEAVTEFARDLARILWNMGYRLVEEQ